MEMIFGVPIEGSSWEQVKVKLDTGEKLWLVTANPEILLEAREDAAYREVIKRADLRLVDGTGLFFAMCVLPARNASRSEAGGRRKVRRLTGVELSEHLLQYAWQCEWRIGFLGGVSGEAERSAEDIRMKYRGIHIHVEQGGMVTRDGKEDLMTEEARHRMTLFSPHVLLVAFGHPRQEFWIDAHRQEFPELKAVVGVGGTFNYWAGYSKRPPGWLRAFGLEWLGRLIWEPKRWRRIWRAVVVFPISFLLG